MIIRWRVAIGEFDVPPQLFQLCDQDGVGYIDSVPADHEVGAVSFLEGWSHQRFGRGNNGGFGVGEAQILLCDSGIWWLVQGYRRCTFYNIWVDIDTHCHCGY